MNHLLQTFWLHFFFVGILLTEHGGDGHASRGVWPFCGTTRWEHQRLFLGWSPNKCLFPKAKDSAWQDWDGERRLWCCYHHQPCLAARSLHSPHGCLYQDSPLTWLEGHLGAHRPGNVTEAPTEGSRSPVNAVPWSPQGNQCKTP